MCELVPWVLDFYGVHITQLTPNAIGIIVGFEILCWEKDRDPSIDLFRYHFQMKISEDWFSFSIRVGAPKLMYGFPNLIKGWKG